MLSTPTKLTLAPLRMKLIEVVALNVLTGAHVTESPMPITKLLEIIATKAIVKFFDDDFERGFCFEKELKRHVYINTDMSPGSDLHPVARLLGILMLDHLRSIRNEMTETKMQKIQLEADYFAECLLAPRK